MCRRFSVKWSNIPYDGDGLDDGVETLRLGTNTNPMLADSDGDGILDNVEVAGFVYGNNNQHWYLDPNSSDTNQDGRLDSVECPQLLDGVQDGNGVCDDNDNDGILDVFDRDDDGDGLADRIDLYPDGVVGRNGLQTSGTGLAYFDGSHPFNFKVEALQTGQPVFVDFQIVPKEREHLTYALNVLDWPSTDLDGQVQHVKNTTFASTMSADQVQATPSAANGDMRLIPLLEIAMGGNRVPLPLTAPAADVNWQGVISGSVHLVRNAATRPAPTCALPSKMPGAPTPSNFTRVPARPPARR